MTIQIVSTSDTPEAVQSAIGGEKPKEVQESEKPAPAPTPESGQKTAAESGTEETETEGEGEAEESESGEGEGDKAESTKAKKSKGGFQRRIDKLNAKRADAERERDYWRNLATQPKGNAGEGTQKPPGADITQSAGKPQAGDFDTHAAYVEALTDWKFAEAKKADKAEAEKNKVVTERQQLVNTYKDKENAFVEKTKDYREVLADADDVQLPMHLSEAILQADNGPQLAYELAKNRTELERISKLPPLAAVRELGKFEAKLTSLGSTETKEQKTTKAPKPLDPVGGKGAKVEKDLSDPNISQKEYERIRAKQRAQASA